MRRILVYLITLLAVFPSCQSNHHTAYNIPDPDCTGVFYLCTDVDKERLGRQAIKAIHEQMDDDKDGMIEASESRDFIQEELQSKTDSVRHRRFQKDDLQITFNDLWTQWQANPIYNWTNDDVIYWLINHVHLPMYVDNFRRNQFDGRMIPRLAANERHYLSAIMQIRDPRHKRRLMIKATDGVLFGPPASTHNLVKDIILMSAVLISFGACLYAFARHRKTQESMKVMLKELETLQKAEGDLISVTGKMKAMEYEMKDKTKVDRGLLNSWFSEIQRTKDEAERFRKHRGSTIDHEKQLRLALQEIEQLRIALRKAEEHAQHQSYEPPSELIDLLKRTYYIEEAAFEIKRKAAEIALLQAKDQMNKITKMQRGFFGAVRIAHTDCIDNISELINAAKERLSDVHDEYEEREKRWNRVASLLDREDLVSNSSSSSISIGNTSAPVNNTSTNNGPAVSRIRGSDLYAFVGTTDSSSRLKQISVDSSNSTTNTNNDSPLSNKTNSNANNRSLPTHPSSPAQIFQQDSLSPNDSISIHSTSPSGTLRRRALTNHGLQSERLGNTSTLIYSNSTNGMNGSNENLRAMRRENTFDSLDLPSLAKQSKPMFDIVSDSQFDNTDPPFDDQQQAFDRNSQLSNAIYDDRQSSSSSSDKGRKSTLSSKLLKPFQMIRHRKKSGET